MRRRGLLVAVTLSALLAPAGLAVAGPDDPGPRAAPLSTGPRTEPGPALQSDRDRDRVADDFEERLRGADSSRELAVIVTGLGVVAAERAVGRFDLTRRLGLIDGFAATMTAGQARALARTPGVRRVEADGRVRALDDATDLDFGAAQARADTPGLDGSGVGICVIDTGIDPAHEQFAGRPVTFTDLVNGRTAPYDDHGHGTHVAAIAAGDGTGGAEAATFNGVAPAAELYVAKVLDSRGFGADSDVAAAVEWCHQQPGVDVISMSLGSDGGDGTDAVSLAVDRAAGEGDVVVVAAGNSGDEPGTISSPGVAKSALTVAAVSDHSAPPGTDRRDNGIWLAAFSSRGPTVDGRTKPDVAAPGVTVRAARAGTTAGYVTYSGTSMATPYVAGAVALAREAAPSASPATIRSALMSAAVDVGAAGSDNEWGAGLVDVRALVDAVRGLSPVRRTAFPARQHLTGTVPTNGYVDIPVDIGSGDLGVPIAVTMTAGGEAICYYSCLIVEWSPDLDLRLTDPSGTVVARSECALSGVSCGIGRQETIGFRPTVTGRHTLRVYAFTGSPNNGEGGSFEVDLLRGPLEGAVVEPPPAPNLSPVADAGPDQTVRAKGKTRRASVTLDASGSTDPDGTIVRHEWRRGTEVVGTTARVTLSLPVGTYTYTVQVTDDDGAVDDDSVTVVVR